ncbi:MAG: polymer-forming cytoskeletal protein [Gammaproteobacteria bacterium]|jgi:cytoskeletal protein CcmA (bactofilin family)|nr:polymer-forming cytoskeletal protein [Xanthomonadales bacterium]
MFNSKEAVSSSNASSKSSSKLDTLLGKNTQINGDINFNGILHLDGFITGSVKGSQTDDLLTISESGTIEGKIEVANVVVNGKIKGDIIATGKIEIAAKADIQGNIYYQNIEMEAGSKINGQLIYQDSNKAPDNKPKEEKKK